MPKVLRFPVARDFLKPEFFGVVILQIPVVPMNGYSMLELKV
jgi:hypothetical protein